MRVRQSDIATWAKCPLAWKFANIDGLEREQSGSLSFGSILHDCVLYMETHNDDLDGAIARFEQFWANPSLLDPEYAIDYYVRGTNWRKFLDIGRKALRDWHSIISWDTDAVLAREFHFEVPIGNDGHVLDGTIDKLTIRYRADIGKYVILISDYKTNKKTPTYDYLAENLQFSAYGYATTTKEFWEQLFPGGHGLSLMQQYQHAPRYGEWVQLQGPKRMDAGIREQRHFNRIAMAVDALAMSVAMRIFIPNISGETCRFCEFRKVCGLPELDDEGNEI